MSKKTLGGLFGALAGIAAAIVATNQPHKKAEPWPPAALLAAWAETCRGVVPERIHRPATDAEVSACVDLAKNGFQIENLRLWADGLPLPDPPAPAIVSLAALGTDGPIFTANGQPFRWKGVTAFGLLNRFAKGEDISGFLSDFDGFNVLRVFLYTPVKDWGASAWNSPAPDVVLAFLKAVEAKGFYVELVLLTDDDATRIEPARQLVEALKAARPPNVVLEVGNEPQTHKAINTAALRATLAGSSFLYSSGDYEDSRKWFGNWIGFHSARDGEWPRRAHDAIDYFHGGGPNFPEEPALKVPAVCDEPIRPDQTAGNREQDFLAYFAACSLLGAGGTYHFESGKLGNRPTEDEKRFAAIALQGLSTFPADAPKGAYSRPDEGGATLRTYRVGPYVVRIRPTDGKVIQ